MSGGGEETIGIAIPAFQAEPWLGAVVERTLTLARSRSQLGPVLVVDDGSSDGTAEVARSAGAEVVSHSRNRGKGVALRTGFRALLDAGCERVVTLDADGQHLPEEVPKLLAPLASDDPPDLVLGTRDHLFAGMSTLRRWSNRLSSRAISLAAGRPLRDVQTGFRLYGRALIEAVPFSGARFEAESAIVVRAARRGFRVVSVPVELGFPDGRATSHYRPLVDSVRIACAVTAARFDPRAVRRVARRVARRPGLERDRIEQESVR